MFKWLLRPYLSAYPFPQMLHKYGLSFEWACLWVSSKLLNLKDFLHKSHLCSSTKSSSDVSSLVISSLKSPWKLVFYLNKAKFESIFCFVTIMNVLILLPGLNNPRHYLYLPLFWSCQESFYFQGYLLCHPPNNINIESEIPYTNRCDWLINFILN